MPDPLIPRIWEGERNQWVSGSEGEQTEWRIADLIDAVKNEPVFDLDIAHLDLSCMRFENHDLYEFAQHVRHVWESDIEVPVIMDYKGCILDGRHRIVKCLLLGRTHIKCRKMSRAYCPTRL